MARKADYYRREDSKLMEMTRTRLFCFILGIVIAPLWMGASPLTAQNDCVVVKKVLADAMSKIHSTPTHVYTTTKIGGKTFSSEMIYAAGTMYMKINGKWTSAGSIEDMEQTEQSLKRNANSTDTCRHVKDEPVDGAMTAEYSSHSETPKGKLDMQCWISKSSGRLLRQEMTSDGGKAVISSRYEYGNVKPPL
jgi:hypothetical protein